MALTVYLTGFFIVLWFVTMMSRYVSINRLSMVLLAFAWPGLLPLATIMVLFDDEREKA